MSVLSTMWYVLCAMWYVLCGMCVICMDDQIDSAHECAISVVTVPMSVL